MSLLHKLVRQVRSAWWRSNHKDFLLVFNWHQITPDFNPRYHHRYTWTEFRQFQAAIKFLAGRFRILPLHEAVGLLKRGRLEGPCAALTFDDGDISVSEHVVPLLTRLGLPATFFINTAYLDGRRTYWFPILSFLSADVGARTQVPENLLEEARQLRQTKDALLYDRVRSRLELLVDLLPCLDSRLVSSNWLSSLDAHQFAIGAHGHEHQRFSMMQKEWQRRDLKENVRLLSRFGAFRPIFAVPFGRPHDWTEDTVRIARELGLDVALANGGVNLASDGCYRRNPSDGKSMRRLLAEAFAHP